MTLTYQAFHWGDSPQGSEDFAVFTGPGGVVGRLAAISYTAEKDGLAEVYRHQFETPPDLVYGGHPGSRRLKPPPRSTILLGRAIDAELEDGERVIFAGLWIITDTQGSRIWLASEGKVPVQVGDGPIVTAHGIEK